MLVWVVGDWVGTSKGYVRSVFVRAMFVSHQVSLWNLEMQACALCAGEGARKGGWSSFRCADWTCGRRSREVEQELNVSQEPAHS